MTDWFYANGSKNGSMSSEELQWYNEEYCLEQVSLHPPTIKSCKVQTDEMARIAITYNPVQLKNIRNQTIEIVMLALDVCCDTGNTLIWLSQVIPLIKFNQLSAEERIKVEEHITWLKLL